MRTEMSSKVEKLVSNHKFGFYEKSAVFLETPLKLRIMVTEERRTIYILGGREMSDGDRRIRVNLSCN